MTRRSFIRQGALATAAAATAQGAETAASPKEFAHIAIRAKDLDKSLDWYSNVLGTRVALHTGRGAFATYDHEHHRISFFSRPNNGPLPERLQGFDRMAFGYRSLDELVHNYRRLKAVGITPAKAAELGPVISLYYKDPTGLVNELFVERFDSAGDLEKYCADGCLAESQGGLDPDKLSGKSVGPADKIIAPSSLAHTVIKTQQYERMIDWYKLALNCQVKFQNDRVTFLSYDGTQHRIAIVNEKNLVAPGPTHGFDHYAFEFKTMEDLAVKTYARLKEHGITPYWPTNHGMTTSFYYVDPDLNRVELQVDNFRTKAECWDYITGPAFKANFIGVDVNPDALVDMVRGGATYEQMHHRVEVPRTTRVPSPYAPA